MAAASANSCFSFSQLLLSRWLLPLLLLLAVLWLLLLPAAADPAAC
jgi:hypothetical protein